MRSVILQKLLPAASLVLVLGYLSLAQVVSSSTAPTTSQDAKSSAGATAPNVASEHNSKIVGCADEVTANFADRMRCPFCVRLIMQDAYQTHAYLLLDGWTIHDYPLAGTDRTRVLRLWENSSRLMFDYLVTMRGSNLRAGSGNVQVVFVDAFGHQNSLPIWEVSWDPGPPPQLNKKWIVPFCGHEEDTVKAKPTPSNAVIDMQLEIH